MYPHLEGRGYFSVEVRRSATRLQAKGHIGIIPINDRLTLEVVPRVSVDNLSHLLEVSESSPSPILEAFRSYRVQGAMYPSLVAVYARALRSEIEAIAAQGFLRDYERREETTCFPRGRVVMSQTIQHSWARGLKHKLAISRFHRTVDVGVNRVLLHAVWRLSLFLRQLGSALGHDQRRAARRDLNATLNLLHGVDLDVREEFLDDAWVTGARGLPSTRAYYRTAIDLALVVVGREAVLLEERGSRVHLPSLVLDMATVFENYVRNVLVRAGQEESWPAQALDGNEQPPQGAKGRLFRSGEYVEASPDIVMRHLRPPGAEHDEYPVLIEVKYRPATGRPKRDDLNQAISYGLAYGSRHVVLVQPRAPSPGSAGEFRRIGEIGGITVSQYIFDLASSDIDREEEAWARAVLDLIEG